MDSGEADPEVEAEVPVSSLAFGAAARAALVAVDSVDLEDEFLTRACVIQCVPAFLRGLYRSSMRSVLIEADRAREASDTVAPLPGLEVVPHLASLVAPPRGGNIPKCRLLQRFSDFAAGRLSHLLEESRLSLLILLFVLLCCCCVCNLLLLVRLVVCAFPVVAFFFVFACTVFVKRNLLIQRIKNKMATQKCMTTTTSS